MFRTIYKTVRPADGAWEKADQESYRETEAIWLLDTIMLTAIPPSHTVGAGVVAHPKGIEPEPPRSIPWDGINGYRAKSLLRSTHLERYPFYHEDMHTANTEQTMASRIEQDRI